MKIKFLLPLFILVLAVSAQAQYKPFSFGLKAAPQIGWMKSNVDEIKADGSKMGFGWGFISEFYFSENHSIATGFNMLFDGGKLKYVDSVGNVPGTTSRKYFLKYLEIPVTLKMRTNEIGGIRYFGQIGLGTAFRIGSKVSDAFNNADYTEKVKYDKVNFIRESLIVGAGAEYPLSEGTTLGASILFNNGFTDVLTGSTKYGVKEKATPNFLELNVFVLF